MDQYAHSSLVPQAVVTPTPFAPRTMDTGPLTFCPHSYPHDQTSATPPTVSRYETSPETHLLGQACHYHGAQREFSQPTGQPAGWTYPTMNDGPWLHAPAPQRWSQELISLSHYVDTPCDPTRPEEPPAKQDLPYPVHPSVASSDEGNCKRTGMFQIAGTRARSHVISPPLSYLV